MKTVGAQLAIKNYIERELRDGLLLSVYIITMFVGESI